MSQPKKTGHTLHCFACGELFSVAWAPGDNVTCECGQEYTTDYREEGPGGSLKPFIVRAVAGAETPDDDEQTWGGE